MEAKRTYYELTVTIPGAQKPVESELHYTEAAANYRADIKRAQAKQHGWNVVIAVRQVI